MINREDEIKDLSEMIVNIKKSFNCEHYITGKCDAEYAYALVEYALNGLLNDKDGKAPNWIIETALYMKCDLKTILAIIERDKMIDSLRDSEQ